MASDKYIVEFRTSEITRFDGTLKPIFVISFVLNTGKFKIRKLTVISCITVPVIWLTIFQNRRPDYVTSYSKFSKKLTIKGTRKVSNSKIGRNTL